VMLRLRAPAKINWSLEVLGERPDGYHELRSVLQTIALCDEVLLEPAPPGPMGTASPIQLHMPDASALQAEIPTESNLAYRAARSLQEESGRSEGVSITLRKGIPVAAGLGGGSSDAAAVLRGLDRLWGLNVPSRDLLAIAGALGSDVPFFLRGGTALASGRGEQVVPLSDTEPRRLVVACPSRHQPLAGKTARVYAALGPEHYTDGSLTARLAERLRRGGTLGDEDVYNAFERVLSKVLPDASSVFERAVAGGLPNPHLAGSGPAVFFLLDEGQAAEPVLGALRSLGLEAAETRTLSAAEAAAWTEE
jgi:4-diphosphocytidyl-2-C-methyl-D-erythritol kinase